MWRASRSTVWRWKQKWLKLNENVQQDKPGRPTRKTSFVPGYYRWNIQTLTSAPHFSPQALADTVVQRVLELRSQLKRCAEVIWHHLNYIEAIQISLSSVHRILKRHHQYDGTRKNRVRPSNPEWPLPTQPGQLVQSDTIHFVCPITKQRRYVYTVIDLYSRMAYTEVQTQIRPGIAAYVVLNAQDSWGFKLSMVQADNGPEFSAYFEQRMYKNGITVRHSRLGRPNDNAHIERFNRTIQDECLGRTITHTQNTKKLQNKINNYIEFYNTQRVHLGLELQTPVSIQVGLILNASKIAISQASEAA